MKWQRLICFGLVNSVVFAFAAAVACAESAKPDFTETESILTEGIKNRAFPGCSVSVGTAKTILWSAAFGRFDYGEGARAGRDTIYDLASVTKVAGTTAVCMRLVALGKVRVSDPISKYLPEFVEAATSDEERTWRSKITLEHLLTHSAGLWAWKPLYKSANSYAEVLKAIYATPLESEPGEKYRYSDLGMMLAGEVASRAGGKPLAQLERELVFVPLGMKDTVRNPATNLWSRIPPTERVPDSDQFVHGVVHDENARAGEGLTGHAGLFSTAEDLGKLAAELLRGLEGRSRLFPKEVVTEFLRDRQSAKGSHRTLGWGLTQNPDESHGPAVAHNGFTGTYVWIDPKQKLFVVLLTNRVHPTRDNNKIGPVRGEFLEAVLKAVE